MAAAQTTLLLLLLVYSCLFMASSAKQPYCSPSSCGIIRNISYPFRLKGDPSHCGYREAELVCENNVTFLYFNSHKFYVKEINYTDYVLRLVDASININDVCSFPTYSDSYYDLALHSSYYFDQITHPVNLITCPQPLNTHVPLSYTDTSHCQLFGSRFNYVRIGRMKASEVPETCRVDVIESSWEFENLNHVSLQEIHRSLLYGCRLYFCLWCNTSWTLWDRIKSFISGVRYRIKRFISGARVLLLIPVVIIVIISAGGSVPVMIIVGFTCGLILLFVPLNGNLSDIISIIMICIPRFFICPLIVWLLIYKFRRRHLSMYEAIESFLQSNNNLMPIRYKYSDIHKITKGFRDKLGEGGYGSVYKGKIRSGYLVAVKLLGKSSANSQDFMNEIATIGRIHHVNVVKLVGYCAERSKRALVFDFMPNGSLDKYIFNQEEKNCLDWDTMFRIAIGVARGIEYLHCGCDIQILHFDIKPHNILLDDKFVPKISDFGLAKLCCIEKDTVTLTAARGTIGYVAPELINRNIGRVSYKADVYSFGMMLMGMVGFNRNLKDKNDDSTKYFPYCVYDHLNQDRDLEIANVEETINGDDGNDSIKRLVRKMTIVALWCIQMCPDDRPSMSKVLEMLESDVECLRIPDYPSHSQHITTKEEEEETWSTDDSVSLLHSNDTIDLETRTKVEYIPNL